LVSLAVGWFKVSRNFFNSRAAATSQWVRIVLGLCGRRRSGHRISDPRFIAAAA
jgi:hypothetical protein